MNKEIFEKALSISKQSNDPVYKVGAVIVKDNEIVSSGYNCMPEGKDDLYPFENIPDDEYNSKHFYVCHAEMNAILNARQDLRGCSIYVTLFPCTECAKAIIQSGIKKVYYLEEYGIGKPYNRAVHRMFINHNIELIKGYL